MEFAKEAERLDSLIAGLEAELQERETVQDERGSGDSGKVLQSEGT